MWPPRDDDVLEALRSAWHDGSWGQYCSGHVARLERAADNGLKPAVRTVLAVIPSGARDLLRLSRNRGPGPSLRSG
jgi:hypothetical protein